MNHTFYHSSWPWTEPLPNFEVVKVQQGPPGGRQLALEREVGHISRDKDRERSRMSSLLARLLLARAARRDRPDPLDGLNVRVQLWHGARRFRCRVLVSQRALERLRFRIDVDDDERCPAAEHERGNVEGGVLQFGQVVQRSPVRVERGVVSWVEMRGHM